jgi:hypothetical protein
MIIIVKGHWKVHSNKSSWIKGRLRRETGSENIAKEVHLIVVGAFFIASHRPRMWSNELHISSLAERDTHTRRAMFLFSFSREENKSYPKLRPRRAAHTDLHTCVQ